MRAYMYVSSPPRKPGAETCKVLRRCCKAKNFQLALRQKPQHVICQQPSSIQRGSLCCSWLLNSLNHGQSAEARYGKLGPTNFGLDFRYPMSFLASLCSLGPVQDRALRTSSLRFTRTTLHHSCLRQPRRYTSIWRSHVNFVLAPWIALYATGVPCAPYLPLLHGTRSTQPCRTC